MKTRLILALTLGLSTSAFGQFQKGDWLVGAQVGGLTLNTSGNRNFSVRLTPSAAKLLTNRFVLGLSLPISYSRSASPSGFSDDFTVTNVTVAPFLRYYLTETRLRPYIGAGAGFSSLRFPNINPTFNRIDYTINRGTNWNATLGAAYVINRHLTFDATLVYQRSNMEGLLVLYQPNQFTLDFGLNIFLGR